MSSYLILKALHLVFMVAWFAGLFYVVRLFIYHVEAGEKPEAEKSVLQPQLLLMASRLWNYIAFPAMVGTAIFGSWLMMEVEAYRLPWFHVKLTLLVILFAYHFRCGAILRNLDLGRNRMTSKQLRLWNELPTLLLFGIVFTAVFKSPWGAMWGMGGILITGIILMLVIKIVRKSHRN